MFMVKYEHDTIPKYDWVVLNSLFPLFYLKATLYDYSSVRATLAYRTSF